MYVITFKEEGGHEFERARGDTWEDSEEGKYERKLCNKL